jgi:hypothetical protein
MPRKSVQMSLLDIYKDVENRLETDKPALFKLLDEHIKWYEIIPDSFYLAFYKQFGRSRKYQLESFMRALFLQRLFHYVEDSQLLNTLRFSREIDKKLADMLTLDTTGIESYVAENNPKFLRSKEQQAKSISKIDPTFDDSGGALALMSKVANSNPAVKLQYINGHFCYAQKAVIITNGIGIVRHL